MATSFDTLAAAKRMEGAGMDRRQAEAVASAIRAGQDEPAVTDGLPLLHGDITAVQWMAGINLAISVATLAAVLAMLFRT